MSETTSLSKFHSVPWYLMTGAALAAAWTSIGENTVEISDSTPTLVKGSLLETETISKTQSVPGEAETWEEMRITKIKSLRGKYKNYLSPSDEFARGKKQEIYLES